MDSFLPSQFDLSSSAFPWTDSLLAYINHRRKTFPGGKLFFDDLLKLAGVEAYLYPPSTPDQLLSLLSQIHASRSFSQLKRDCLIYYLLSDYDRLPDPENSFISDGGEVGNANGSGRISLQRNRNRAWAAKRLLPPGWVKAMDAWHALDSSLPPFSFPYAPTTYPNVSTSPRDDSNEMDQDGPEGSAGIQNNKEFVIEVDDLQHLKTAVRNLTDPSVTPDWVIKTVFVLWGGGGQNVLEGTHGQKLAARLGGEKKARDLVKKEREERAALVLNFWKLGRFGLDDSGGVSRPVGNGTDSTEREDDGMGKEDCLVGVVLEAMCEKGEVLRAWEVMRGWMGVADGDDGPIIGGKQKGGSGWGKEDLMKRILSPCFGDNPTHSPLKPSLRVLPHIPFTPEEDRVVGEFCLQMTERIRSVRSNEKLVEDFWMMRLVGEGRYPEIVTYARALPSTVSEDPSRRQFVHGVYTLLPEIERNFLELSLKPSPKDKNQDSAQVNVDASSHDISSIPWEQVDLSQSQRADGSIPAPPPPPPPPPSGAASNVPMSSSPVLRAGARTDGGQKSLLKALDGGLKASSAAAAAKGKGIATPPEESASPLKLSSPFAKTPARGFNKESPSASPLRFHATSSPQQILRTNQFAANRPSPPTPAGGILPSSSSSLLQEPSGRGSPRPQQYQQQQHEAPPTLAGLGTQRFPSLARMAAVANASQRASPSPAPHVDPTDRSTTPTPAPTSVRESSSASAVSELQRMESPPPVKRTRDGRPVSEREKPPPTATKESKKTPGVSSRIRRDRSAAPEPPTPKPSFMATSTGGPGTRTRNRTTEAVAAQEGVRSSSPPVTSSVRKGKASKMPIQGAGRKRIAEAQKAAAAKPKKRGASKSVPGAFPADDGDDGQHDDDEQEEETNADADEVPEMVEKRPVGRPRVARSESRESASIANPEGSSRHLRQRSAQPTAPSSPSPPPTTIKRKTRPRATSVEPEQPSPPTTAKKGKGGRLSTASNKSQSQSTKTPVRRSHRLASVDPSDHGVDSEGEQEDLVMMEVGGKGKVSVIPQATNNAGKTPLRRSTRKKPSEAALLEEDED